MSLIFAVGAVLLTFGGYIAGSPLVSAVLPINISLIGAIIVAISLPFAYRSRLAALLPLALLWLIFLIGFLPDVFATPYAEDKRQALVTLTPLVAIAGAWLFQQEKPREWLLRVLVAFGVVVAALQYFAPVQTVGAINRLYGEGTNAISTARAAAAVIIILLVFALAGRRHRTICVLASLPFWASLVATESRGPLIATAVALVAIALTAASKRHWAPVVLVSLAAATAWWMQSRFGFLPARLTTVDDSALARSELAGSVLEIIPANPFGIGWGGLEVELAWYASSSGAVHPYPHNVLLEVFAEGGWFAGLALIGVLILAYIRQLRHAQSATELAILGLLVFFAISMLVSGDVNSSRGFWLILGVALASPYVMPRASESSESSSPVDSELSSRVSSRGRRTKINSRR